MPVELLTPEQRERIAELRRAESREWLCYAVVEAIAIFVPFFAFLVWYASSDAGDTALFAAAAAATAASGLLNRALDDPEAPADRAPAGAARRVGHSRRGLSLAA